MANTDQSKLISIGVDWITVVGTNEIRVPSLQSMASELVTLRLRTGFPRKGWGMAGFSGFQSLGVQYGTRDNEVIVRLSGDLAHSHWRKAYALANHCTRIDLECTAAFVGDPASRVRRAFAAATRHSRRKKNGPAVTIVHCTTGGTTCYLGKRQSMIFGRIYDKYAESKDDYYRGAVRFEVEYKSHYARRLAQRLASDHRERQQVASHLQRFFAARGNDLGLTDEQCLSLGAPRSGSNHSRELRWLANQVRPTVQRLVECGLAHEVFQALGFGEAPQDNLDQVGQTSDYEN